MKRKARRSFPLPPMSGGENLDEVLASIEKELKAANEKKEAGDTSVDETIAKLETAKKEAETEIERLKAAEGGDEGETELERLRKFAAEAQIKDIANRAADAAEQAFIAQNKAQQDALESAVSKALAERLGIKDASGLTELISGTLKDTRVPSRFVGEGASAEAVAAAAKGLNTGDGTDMKDLKVGVDREVKEFYDSKSLSRFFGAVYRVRKGVGSEAERKALAVQTDEAGGFLVPQEWMDDILGLIRARTVVRAAGPRIVPFSKQMNQTSISTGATAYYTAENAAITPSEETFAEAALLTPKNLTGLVPVSNYLLDESAEAEDIVREDLAEVLGLKEDVSFIEGTGEGGAPTGFKNMSGITNMTTELGIDANGENLSLDAIRKMMGKMRVLNVRNPNLAFFFHPSVLMGLELQKDKEGRYLLDSGALTLSGDQTGGTIWGVPFYTTTQIPVNLTRGTSSTATYILMVNMSEAVVGISKELAIDSSDQTAYVSGGTWYSAFQNNQTVFRAVIRHDINHRRKNQIIRVDGIESTVA